MSFYEAIEKRRSIYDLDKNIPITDENVIEIIENAIKHTPTAMNSQTGRALLLLNENHDKLWDITKEELRKVVPEKKFKATEEKIHSFKKAYGTILFFEEQKTVQNLQDRFPKYADNFPLWSEQSSGMLQFVIWTALANKKVGASIQHYNPLIDDEVKKQWNVPDTWKLRAQMPFGNVVSPAGEKEFKPIEERFKVHK